MDKAYFTDFVHDALAYDPKGKGILHIAIMDNPTLYLPNGMFSAFVRTKALSEMISTQNSY